MKIYNELESLGFFKWLKEKGFGSGFTPIILDAQPIDSIERSGYNAIAFRWFREKYGLQITIHPDKWCEISKDGLVLKDTYSFKTFEEAELECLKKLIEICRNSK